MPPKVPAPKRVKSMAEIASACASDNTAEGSILTFQSGQKIIFIPFHRIQHFIGHPFRLYVGERLSDMVESIRQNGILMPLIVRAIHNDGGYDYEMLSGHNRMNAGGLAGLTGAWCVVKENLNDSEAQMYVIETNLMQRSFTDLLPSEKAAVLSMRYTEMFSQGKRNDIIRELQLLEHPDAPLDLTCGTECHKLNRDSLGREYALAGRAVADYLRIGKLTEALKLRLDQGGMTIKAGVALSYLGGENQGNVEAALSERIGKLTDTQANVLRKAGEDRVLTPPTVLELLSERSKVSTPALRLKQEIYAPYFGANTPTKEIERVVGEALKLYFAKKSVGESA